MNIILQCWKEDFWLKILTITSILLIVIAFFIPPMAVVDGSVLAAVGELTGIGALWQFTKAMNKNIDAKVKIKELSLSILNKKEKLDDEENEEGED